MATLTGNLEVNGNVNVTGTMTVTGGITIPTASASTLGGIKVGNRLSIDSEGVLSATDQSYTLPTASASTLGGVKVGDGLEIEEGVLSVEKPPMEYDLLVETTERTGLYPLSLYGAIFLAKANKSNPVIAFAESLAGQTLQLPADTIIDAPLTIDASNLAEKPIITSSGRVFKIKTTGDVKIKSVKIAGGNTSEFGGGVYIDPDSVGSTVTLEDCIISGNRSSLGGAGVAGYAQNNLVIKKCIITGNTTTANGTAFGGGIFFHGTKLTLRDCMIYGNVCTGGANTTSRGVGLNLSSGNADIIQCLIADNQSQTKVAYGVGLCLDSTAGEVIICNTTIAGNIHSGEGLLLGGGINTDAGGTSCTIVSCLICNNDNNRSNLSDMVFNSTTASIDSSAYSGSNSAIGETPVIGSCLNLGAALLPMVFVGGDDIRNKYKLKENSAGRGNDSYHGTNALYIKTDLSGGKREKGYLDYGCYEG